MRLERLTLERYGHFADRTLDLGGDGVRLHVVFGPNEAGKSTLLAAVGDLLFGFPHRTPFGFRWDTSELRLAATVTNDAGERLAFKRRKGRDRTLLGETGAPLPEGALDRFLGSADRGLFERMFGLDHARLRDGGAAMLQAGGDLTRSLFEAGSGLARVGEARSRIERQLADLGALGARKASTKPLWREIDRFTSSQQRMRADALRGDEWREAEQALDSALETRRRLADEAAALRRRRARLDRIRRVGPILLALDQRAERLAALPPPTSRLPEGFEAEWRAAADEARDAERALRHEGDALAQLVREAAEAPAPLGFEARRDEIDALHVTLGEFLKDESDEPKLVQALAADDRLIADHLARLGRPPDLDAVGDSMPSDLLIAHVRDLAGRGKDLRARLDALGSERDRARDAVEEAEAAHPLPVPDPAEAAARLAEALALGPSEDRLAQAERGDAAAERDLREGLGRLTPWQGGAEDLAARPAPSREVVTQFARQRQELDDALADAERRRREAEAGLLATTAEEEGLGELGEIPSPAAVGAARDRRDRAWRLLRARLDGDLDDRPAPGDAPAAFEALLRHADALADRREAETFRLQRLADLAIRRKGLEAGRDAAGAARDLTLGQLRDHADRWAGVWAGLIADPDAPPAMLDWLRQRDEVLRLLSERRQAAEALSAARRLAEGVRDHLRAAAGLLGLADATDGSPGDLLRRVQRALAEAQQAWADQRSRALARAEAGRRLARLGADVARTEADLDAWRRSWSDAMARLHLDPTTSVAEAEAALLHWQNIRERWGNRSQTRSRLDGLRRDVREVRARLGALLADLGPIAADLDPDHDPDGPATAIRALRDRLQQDHLRIDRAAELSARILETRRRAAALDLRLAEARDRCRALRRAHGLAEETDPLDAAAEGRHRRTLEAETAAERDRLRSAGDGLDEAALREEAGSVPPDDRAAALQALDDEAHRIEEAGQAAAQAETSARQRLQALEGRAGAADAAQEMRHAGNAIAALSDRWMRLEAARHLLDRAMERFRAENEHPLLRRAGEIFRLIASGGAIPWAGLEVRHGQGDAPVLVAVRADGSTCEVEGLSEGTRDQLYLALRIGAVERHAADHGALPFLADDLFITSDDHRLAPGLAALAELGRTVQVVLFTHHRHVLDAARAALPPGSLREHRL
ncbi:YhaN family protein [Rubellimicrobium aerolatum]|uniref:AAA family ATPase n=1 Tax=Rubellimicrobium aerolatum TaxID=490979 RepID=A0ABW0SGI7_9RHOB|nr:YhaN family protein [Rubellimicrobium aerolatum]MBP1807440.1 uncharacterized protein YhaN [Rubellimicrobium aerolatum]